MIRKEEVARAVKHEDTIIEEIDRDDDTVTGGLLARAPTTIGHYGQVDGKSHAFHH